MKLFFTCNHKLFFAVHFILLPNNVFLEQCVLVLQVERSPDLPLSRWHRMAEDGWSGFKQKVFLTEVNLGLRVINILVVQSRLKINCIFSCEVNWICLEMNNTLNTFLEPCLITNCLLLKYYSGKYDPSWPADEWSQRAGVQYILDTVVRELAVDTNRRWGTARAVAVGQW